MMILTMAPSDTPTTTTIPMLACNCPSKIDINNNVTCSIESSNSVSNSSCEKMVMKKRVSFSLQQTSYFSSGKQLSTQRRKEECWYSEAELNVSRDEARMAIHALHHQLQLDAAAAAAVSTTGTSITEPTSIHMTGTESSSSSVDLDSTSSDGTENGWVLRCPQDKSKIVCLRGIEKYADAASKYAGQKRLVKSVLEQQTLNNKDVHISLVSRTLSEPFKEVARYYAMKSADELELSRKHEETERKQREEVATVLLLIMGQQQQKLQRNAVLVSSATATTTTKKLMVPLSSPRKSITSNSSLAKHGLIHKEKGPIVTLPGSITGSTISSSKRNSPPCSPLSERNVKPCIRSISN